MTCGTKTLCAIRDSFPEKTRLLIMNALVISHVHYSVILLNGISENLLTTLEKQLRWAVKACFNRRKCDHSADLKLLHDILPMRYFLKLKSVLFFWKFYHNVVPSLLNDKISTTAVIRQHKRTNQINLNVKSDSIF